MGCLQTLEGAESVTICVVFSRWENDKTVKLWDVTNVSKEEGPYGVWSVSSFSTDGSKLLTASSQEVIIYKMPSAQQWKLRLALQQDRLDLLHSILNSF